MKITTLMMGACALALSTFAIAGAASAAETIVTPSNMDGWAPANLRALATVAITGTYAPTPGETGSLEFKTQGVTSGSSQDKADMVHSVSGTLGDLVNNPNAVLGYDYLVSSSSKTSNLAPVLRLDFDNGNGQVGSLIWEQVYNGGVGATDTWQDKDILNGNFWMHNTNGTVEQFGFGLDDWADGSATGVGAYTLSANTQITAIELGVGSGWNNDFDGAVDHVNLNFGTAGTSGVSSNFELTSAGAVPEPASWALMILGFGGVGAALRSKRRKAIFA